MDGAKDKIKSVFMIFQIKDAIRFMTNATHKFVINSKEKSRPSQRSQPYSVSSRKVKTVGSKKSIGAIGQTVHGLKENKQVCPLCHFEATTKNPYRHLQDHLGELLVTKPN